LTLHLRQSLGEYLALTEGMRPSPLQYKAFARYLGTAEDWRKRLPLLTGGHFVVFIARDAGVLSPVSAEAAGKSSDYRARYGFLDYMVKIGGDEYVRANGKVISLPDEIEQQCSFLLYPFAPNGAVDTLEHRDALKALANGEAHPERDELLELAQLDHDLFWKTGLSDAEADLASVYLSPCLYPFPDDPPIDVTVFPAAVRQYFDGNRHMLTIIMSLYQKELAKIERALANLDRLLMQ
jgi:hypothetical protein